MCAHLVYVNNLYIKFAKVGLPDTCISELELKLMVLLKV